MRNEKKDVCLTLENVSKVFAKIQNLTAGRLVKGNNHPYECGFTTSALSYNS